MLNAWINTKTVWFCNFTEGTPAVDANGDYTGEFDDGYGKVQMTRANLSPSRGTEREDLFGANLAYSKTMSTSKMDLDIDERTILWDEQPAVDASGYPTDPLSAKYRVAAIARGHYQVHYALREMNVNHENNPSNTVQEGNIQGETGTSGVSETPNP